MENIVKNEEENPDSIQKTLAKVEKEYVEKNNAGKRKNKLSLILFLLLIPTVFLGDRLISAYLNSLVMKSNFRFSKLYNGTAEADILLVGNSRGHAFYQPEIRKLTGERTLSLSHNAMPISVTRAFIEDYLEKYSAKKIILEVSLLNNTEANVVNSFKVYRNNSPRLSEVIRKNSEITNYSCLISNLYCYNSTVFHRALYFLNHDDSDHIVEKEISPNLIRNIHKIENEGIHVTQDRMDDFKAIIKLAEDKNIKIELVIGPYYPAYNAAIGNKNEFLEMIYQETGHPVRDYTSLITDKKYFSDYLHLNKIGSLLFVNKLKEDNVL